MLFSLPTLLSRSQRARKPLLFVDVSTFELAVATIRAAEHLDRPVVLSIDVTSLVLYSLEYVVGAALILGRLSSALVCVEVRIDPTHGMAEQAVSAGAMALTVKHHCERAGQLESTLTWISGHAAARNVGLVLELADRGPQSLAMVEQLAKHAPLVALRLPVLDHLEKKSTVAVESIQQWQNVTKLPILAASADYSPSHLRRFASLRIAGPLLDTELEEAFTAGLRTALRDREANSPRRYFPKGQLAVEEQLIRLAKVLCQK